ncbi:NTP transferase domain-containing protein [Desulfofundulus thermobenzoicus]|uniref:NTP transferase domain-containing protein n=1 Tax=Desulfofundulus thermobenzoicus TaxID=29376 RepID=A0A6N7ILD2_9FIRM|nr:NTP transferase domain-containing protein [Desulfofundulus thermobenzoicus]MQL50790.1 NTP transferase domain-containing protein [Desulfofundulus thermobenzoicus]
MGEPEGIAAIVLAAGYSSRMGDCKPLLRLGPYSAVEHAVRCFFRAGIRDVRVVTGHRAEAVAAAVRPLGAGVIFNPRFDQGMYSSVQAGVETLGAEVEAFFLLPADHPLIRVSTIEKMLHYYRTGKKGIIYPAYGGRRGHPPLISARYVYEIRNGTYPDGLQELLNKYEHDALDVAVEDEGVVLDMDTPEDYRNLLYYLESRAVPTVEECRRILREARVSEAVWEHCHTVAALAFSLVKHLNRAGVELDEDLVLAGALLHDVARAQPQHARAGAELLQARGYPRVAAVVAAHMDIDVDEAKPLAEAEVVFLADKMVKGRGIVSISDRLAGMLETYCYDRQACRAARQRLKKAELIKKKVEKILGRPVEAVQPENWLSRETNSTEVEVNA